ncbi:hypothetical protein BDZ91DRAFT_765379 [Kalaharituber pfeilii]|nr:hypothetical protein BDZ91DRAFT_765379 [Kalaharituber pfeilii]
MDLASNIAISLLSLPIEVHFHILSYLPSKDLKGVALVCRALRTVAATALFSRGVPVKIDVWKLLTVCTVKEVKALLSVVTEFPVRSLILSFPKRQEIMEHFAQGDLPELDELLVNLNIQRDIIERGLDMKTNNNGNSAASVLGNRTTVTDIEMWIRSRDAEGHALLRATYNLDLRLVTKFVWEPRRTLAAKHLIHCGASFPSLKSLAIRPVGGLHFSQQDYDDNSGLDNFVKAMALAFPHLVEFHWHYETSGHGGDYPFDSDLMYHYEVEISYVDIRWDCYFLRLLVKHLGPNSKLQTVYFGSRSHSRTGNGLWKRWGITTEWMGGRKRLRVIRASIVNKAETMDTGRDGITMQCLWDKWLVIDTQGNIEKSASEFLRLRARSDEFRPGFMSEKWNIRGWKRFLPDEQPVFWEFESQEDVNDEKDIEDYEDQDEEEDGYESAGTHWSAGSRASTRSLDLIYYDKDWDKEM